MNLPPESQQFIQEMIATSNFSSEAEVVTTALDLMRRVRARHEEFKASLLEAEAQLDAGDGGPLDFEELLAEGRRLFARRQAS